MVIRINLTGSPVSPLMDTSQEVELSNTSIDIEYDPNLKVNGLYLILTKHHSFNQTLQVLYQGRVINNLRNLSLSDIGITDGDELTVLNYQKDQVYNIELESETHEKIYGKNSPQRRRMLQMTGDNPEESNERVSPEIIAQATGAKEPELPSQQINSGRERLKALLQMLEDHMFNQIMPSANEISQQIIAPRPILNSQIRQPASPILISANPVKLVILKDMGFDEERSRRLLIHFENDLDRAMNHLLTVNEENDPLVIVGSNNDDNAEEVVNPEEQHNQNVQQASQFHNQTETLIAMGFGRYEALAALRMANGDQEQATEYLLNSDSQQHQLIYEEGSPIIESDLIVEDMSNELQDSDWNSDVQEYQMEQPIEIHMSELLQSENESMQSMPSSIVNAVNDESDPEEISEELNFDEDAS